MKLGFLATKTISGFTSGKPINGGLWTQYVVDIRSLINGLGDFVGTGEDAVLLQFLGKEGFLVGIVLTEVGRPRDNTAVWIHAPAETRISGQKLTGVINDVKGEIRKGLMGLDDIRESCLKFFGQDYEEKGVQQTAVGRLLSKGIGTSANVTGEPEGDNPSASVQEKLEVAGLYYGEGTDYQLHELLGDYLAQPGYKEWRGIFLIDSQSGIKILNEYKHPLRKTVVFSLPDKDYGFTPSYKDKTYRGKIEVTEGSAITVIWERKGYQNIMKTITISKLDEENQRQVQISPNERKYGVWRSWFKVVDEDEADISAGCSIKVNGNELRNGNEPTYLSAVDEYEVVICGHGYKTADGMREFRSKYSSFGNQIINVKLKADRIEKIYVLQPEESNGLKHNAEVRIETRYPDDPEIKMPIIGYELDDGKMVYNDFKSARARIKWFLIGFLVMAAIWGISAGTGYLRKNYTFSLHRPFIERIDSKGDNMGNGSNNGNKDASKELESAEGNQGGQENNSEE